MTPRIVTATARRWPVVAHDEADGAARWDRIHGGRRLSRRTRRPPSLPLHAFLADGGSLQSLATAPVRRRIEGRDAVSAQSVTWGGAVWGIGMNYTSKQQAPGRALP